MAVPTRPPSSAQVQYALRLLKQQGLAAPTAEEVAGMSSVEVSSLLDGLLAKRGKPVFYGNGQFSHWQKGAGEKTAAANLAPMRQRTQFTCVAASTSMALAALGLQDCDEDTVNRVLGAAPMKGAAWEQVLATAQHYGVRATLTVPATLPQVKAWTDAGKPVLIGWNPEGRDWSHASVIFDVQPCPTHGFMVHVADPNCPDPEQTVRIVPKGEFYAKWYEKFPNYLVRRPALVLEREITPEGRQVMASMKNHSPVLVDAPLTVPVSEVPMSKQAKRPMQVQGPKKNPNVMKVEGPTQRNPVVQGLIERGTSGAGKHKNPQDFARGHARNPKHKGQKGWGAEYMTLPVEEACGAEYMGGEACGAEYMQSETARFKTKEEGDKKTVDPTVNMTPEGAAEWKKQNIINRDNFKNKGAGLLPSEVARSRAAAVDGEFAKATRMLTVAMKASRAVPLRMAEQFRKEMSAYHDKWLSVFTEHNAATPQEVQECEGYRAQALGMLKALSGIALPKDVHFYERGMEAVRLLPRINKNMGYQSEVAALAGFLANAAIVIAAKAKDAEWRVDYLTHWLDFYKTNNRPPTWNEQDAWLKERRKMAGLLPSEAARLRSAGLEDACWEGYEAVGMKEQDGKQVPNCVPTKTAAHRLDGVRGHQLLPATVARKLPAVYSQENVADPIAQVKLFSPYSGAVWYLTEYDPSSKQAFGWADMGFGGGELGYISIAELEGMNKKGLPLVERDLYWKPMPLSKAKHSRMASAKGAADTFRPGDMAMWNGKRVMVLDTHGFPPRAVDVRWTESGVSGSKGEVANTKRNVPANQLTKAARHEARPMTEPEKAELFEGNPEFADANKNPPESVLAVRRQMQRQAARYSRDPYWMTAKYSGVDKNGKPFRAGERVFYYPNGKVILTGKEAEAAARDFDAARFDEDGY